MLASVLGIVAGVSSVSAIAAIILLVLQGRDKDKDARIAIAAMRSAMTAQLDAERIQRKAESERDEALVKLAKLGAEDKNALMQLDEVEKQRNDATAKEADDAAKAVASAKDGASALDALNLVLGSVPHLPDVPATGDGGGGASAGAGHGHAGPDAVQPASVADANRARRNPPG